MASLKLFRFQTLSKFLKPVKPLPISTTHLLKPCNLKWVPSRIFSYLPNQPLEAPSVINYHTLVQEDQYHKLADTHFLKSRNLKWVPSRNFSSRLNQPLEGPTPVDYNTLMQEDEYHKLADTTIQNLLEKIEEYGDSVDIDGFDIDYGNQVLTLKIGDSGTFVLNKQTPNRQLWLSSPVSGPSRFDWDGEVGGWVYRRTKAKLLEVLESELEELCGQPIDLS